MKSLVVFPNTNSFCRYIGKALKGYGPDVFGFYKHDGFLFMNLLRLLSIFEISLPKWVLWGKWSQKRNYDSIVLFAEVATKDVIQQLDNNHPNARKILYLWNIACLGKEINHYLIDHSWEIWTFDEEQSKLNNWNYIGQFYDGNILKNKGEIRYQFCFCGYNKGRDNILCELARKFNGLHLNYKFIIREWGIPNYINSYKNKGLRSFITLFETNYYSYLEIIEKSNCIVDIVQNGQIGLTMRVMESLFYNKKLLTNNRDIINYPFYSKDNIFVLGQDNFETITSWLNIPYNTSVVKYCNDYSVIAWYRKMQIEVV